MFLTLVRFLQIEKIPVLVFNVHFFVFHFPKFEHVKHVPMPQEPILESTKSFLHVHLFLVLRTDQQT